MTVVNRESCAVSNCLRVTEAKTREWRSRTYSGEMRRRVKAVILASALVMISQAPAFADSQAAEDYSSFFSQRELVNAGWSACAAPLTWSVDTRGLTARQAQREIKRLGTAWSQWSLASGISAKFTGQERLDFDPATNGLRRDDGSPTPERHVLIAFKSPSQVPPMLSNVVGLAMPSVVLVPTKEITNGMVILRRGYVLEQRKIDPKRVLHLYMHEFGHVMGLGHASGAANVMYPTLDHLVTLGPGDRAGAEAFTRPCARPAGSTTVTITGWWE